MRPLSLPFAFATALASGQAQAAQEILKKEPPAGALRYGQIIYVDNGKCPKGQVMQVMGGHISANTKRNFGTTNTARERKCVARP